MVTLEDWINYLEGQLSSWSTQLNALIALAGLIPSGTIVAGVQWSAVGGRLWILLLVISIGLLITFAVLARLLLRRILLRQVLEAILCGKLTTVHQVAVYYTLVVR